MQFPPSPHRRLLQPAVMCLTLASLIACGSEPPGVPKTSPTIVAGPEGGSLSTPAPASPVDSGSTDAPSDPVAPPPPTSPADSNPAGDSDPASDPTPSPGPEPEEEPNEPTPEPPEDPASSGEEEPPPSEEAPPEQPSNPLCDVEGLEFTEEVAAAASATGGGFNYRYRASAISATSSLFDVSSFASWGGPTTPGTYSLAGINYKDCGLCLLIRTGCTPGPDPVCSKRFYADEGTVEIQTMGPTADRFAAVLHDVVLREVTIDSDYTSTPVESGQRWCLNGFGFDQAVDGVATPAAEPSGPTSPDSPPTTDDSGSSGTGSAPSAPADTGETPTATEGAGLGVLGGGAHTQSAVQVEVFGTARHGLATPKDIASHPTKPHQFWVVNQADNSMSILLGDGAENQWACSAGFYGTGDGCDCGCGVPDPDCDGGGTSACQYGCKGSGQEINPADSTQCIVGAGAPSGQSATTRFFKRQSGDGSGNHFLARPSGLAFGAGGRLATVHEEDRVTQPQTPWEFMGPTLWTSNLQEFEGGHPSHYDMLHNSPNGAGIAYQSGNIYWIYDGEHGSLTRYNFNQDHGPGGTDHGDGIVHRFVDGQMGYVPGVVSGMAYDASEGLLYVADPGNNRIVALNPATGTVGQSIEPNFDGTVQRYVNGATLTTLVDGEAVGLVRPAGLELVDGVLYVSDNHTGRVYAFNRDGEVIDWLALDLPSGSLNGLTLDAAGRLYVVNTSANEIWRVTAR